MNQVQKILDIFGGYRMAPTPIDQYETMGKQILSDKIESFVASNRTIEFVMLGFPFKSTNTRDKVIGALPDLGEELALHTFAKFNSDIAQVYSPGVSISIASDGYIFNDILNVPDRTVDEYAEITADLSGNAPMKWFSLRNFYGMKNGREKIMQHFAPSAQKLEEEILLNPDVNILYRGMSRFMEEELADKDFPSKNQRHVAAKRLAREMMLRNEAWSGLVNKEFDSHIRLSIHPSVNSGKKYSFQLIAGSQYTPWHSAPYVDAHGQTHMLHKKDAIAQGLRLVEKNNIPYYFTD